MKKTKGELFPTLLEYAGYSWWRMHRPVEWSESDHLSNPCVNITSGKAGRRLANEVARRIRENEND